MLSSLLSLSFVAAVLAATAPVALAALGGALCGRAGVFNIALEGQVLWAAFTAVGVSYWTASPWWGVLAAVVTTALLSGILAVGSVRWHADPIIVAVGLNLLALGLTGFLLRSVFDASGTFAPPGLVGLPDLSQLSNVPVLGRLLAGQSVLVPLALLLPVAAAWWLARTPVGLRLRGVGDHPAAATTLGVPVSRYQQLTVLVAGALCGLAGAQLALGNVTAFTENMTAGRGWVAVAAVMLAVNRPVGVLLACLLFGAAEAWGFRLQGIGLPQQLTDAAPYLVTLVVLVLARARRARRSPLPAGGTP
ncbi:simple sugar transport system permease protein [Kineococcus radiotolerans]|uniref:Simple sugar transport system permease protein n=1 Tax=Kineococcus radiotolerans TaxID=131568 RepID=A0A7W4XUZ5_KINRA|nr:ABC transporter permease [Kineococcus radiotolerans]MBB2899268.1 simple sugar transport system permease protein [Kineococcus radiotolerans]